MQAEDVLWVITKDLLYEKDPDDYQGCVGKGQTFEDYERRSLFRFWIHHDIKPDAIEDGVKFRLKDDDGEVYYEGVMREDIVHHSDEDLGTAPHYWAMNDSGCTEMEIMQNGEWVGYVS